MISIILSFLVLLEFALGDFSMIAPTIEIDLSGDPTTIWSSSVDTILKLRGWNHSFGPIFKMHNESLFDNIPNSVMLRFAEVIRHYWPTRYLELTGISSAFEKNGYYVSAEYICAWVYFHELAHTEWQKSPKLLGKLNRGCTGILAYEGEEGSKRVIHGRNMDNVPPELRNVTVHHIFKRNGVTEYESFTWYWVNAGFMTGVKAGVATCEENWRFEKIDSNDAMKNIEKGILPQVWFFREAFENFSSFDDVSSFLQTTPIIVGMYIVSSGPTDGVVISRESGDTGHHQLPVYRLSDEKERFLVQTNYDRWKADPQGDPRRTVAERQMRSLSKFTELSVFATLSTPPVRNDDTAYSCILHSGANFTIEDQCFVMNSNGDRKKDV